MGALFLAVAVAVFTLPGTPDSEPNDTPADRALEPIAPPPVAPGPIDASASDEEVVTDAAERPLLIGPTNTQVSAPEAGVVPVPLRSPAPPSPPEEAPVPGDPEPFGGLSIASSPRASVSLDGELKGITPLDLKVAPGAHEVILTGPENLRWRGRLDIAQGQTLSLERDLTATGRLSVVTNVWAEASLDDGPTEQTPIQFPRVASGLHRLRVFRDGYVTQVREIVIESGETTRVSLTLDKQP